MSEGSFHPHPNFPWISRNSELVLFYDSKEQKEWKGHFTSHETHHFEAELKSPEDLEKWIKKWDFPKHGLLLRAGKKLHKDFESKEQLQEKVSFYLGKLLKPKLKLESDLRAHQNPTRMQGIKKAAENLIEDFFIKCPNCESYNYHFLEPVPGLLCKACELPSKLAKAEKWVCHDCEKPSIRPRKDGKTHIEASHCDICNP